MALSKRAAAREPSAEERRLERKQRRHENRRQMIMDAARRLLVERGIEHFTVAAVASVAGVSKSAVYYYFESKEELVGGLAIHALEQETAVVGNAVDRVSSGVDALDAAVKAYVDHYETDADAFRVLYIWPQVLGVERRIAESEAYSQRQAVNDRLEQKLQEDRASGGLTSKLAPRRLAQLAWLAAHGAVSLSAGLGGAGTGLVAADLRDDVRRLLLSGAGRS